MKKLYYRLLLLIAGATHQEPARHVHYLKTENQILRSKLPKRVPVTLKERNRLVKFSAKLGDALGELTTIVHPDTLRRWIRESTKAKRKRPVSKGRPRTREQIRELVLRLAREIHPDFVIVS
jgi:putative transposase